MSSKSRLRTDFKVAVDHIRDRVIMNLSEAKGQSLYKIDDAELQKLVRVVESAFEQGFITASAQIERSIDESLR